MAPVQPDTLQLVIGYLRLIIESFIFPLGLLTLLYLARNDFKRWVSFKIREEGQEEELREETEEFTQ